MSKLTLSEIGEGYTSDDSRNKAILNTLNLLGYKHDEIQVLEKSWQDFQNHISDDCPEYYDYYFPEDLIDELVQSVIQGCKDIALRSHLDQIEKYDRPISQILNEAWFIASNKPQEFSDWEKEAIENINRSLNP